MLNHTVHRNHRSRGLPRLATTPVAWWQISTSEVREVTQDVQTTFAYYGNLAAQIKRVPQGSCSLSFQLYILAVAQF